MPSSSSEVGEVKNYRSIRITTNGQSDIVTYCELSDSTLSVGTTSGTIHVYSGVYADSGDGKEVEIGLTDNTTVHKKLRLHKTRVVGIRNLDSALKLSLSYDDAGRMVLWDYRSGKVLRHYHVLFHT